MKFKEINVFKFVLLLANQQCVIHTGNMLVKFTAFFNDISIFLMFSELELQLNFQPLVPHHFMHCHSLGIWAIMECRYETG